MPGNSYFEARQGTATYRLYADAKRLVMVRPQLGPGLPPVARPAGA